MISLSGKKVSEGIAIGKIRVIRDNKYLFIKKDNISISDEIDLFQKTRHESILELNKISEGLKEKGDSVSSNIIFAQSELLDDPDFVESIINNIKENQMDAVSAIEYSQIEFTTLFSSMDDMEMKERANDINDISLRMMHKITGINELEDISESYIILTDNITPSQLISLGKDKLLGIITTCDSSNGHTAILSRNYSIPAVSGIDISVEKDLNGKTAIIDGYEGVIIIDPDDKKLKEYQKKQSKQNKDKESLKQYIGMPDKTLNGQVVNIYCNIASPDDTENVKKNDGNGIGLFRTEFLFMNRDSAPSEEEQYLTYSKVLSDMNGKKVIIRTMDIGADKKIPYINQNNEENPQLGLRGIRLSLRYTDLFKTQLRALYRASVYGNLSIMFPMISNPYEVIKAKNICNEVLEELKNDNISVSKYVPIGIMIETPAAALLSKDLAEMVDFFSIGTNDLTQYATAVDRNGENLSEYYDKKQKAVLKLIKMAAKSAHSANIPIGICGEMASDLNFTDKFIKIGINELSVSPNMVLKLRKKIREVK